MTPGSHKAGVQGAASGQCTFAAHSPPTGPVTMPPPSWPAGVTDFSINWRWPFFTLNLLVI